MSYPELDLSRMFELPRCAVRVRTLEDAKTLIDNFYKQYPDRATYFSLEDPGWDSGPDTAYTLFYSDEDEPTSLSRTDYEDFLADDYEVIEFSELMNTVEIEESDMALTDLVGWLS